jgi:siroheme synthase
MNKAIEILVYITSDEKRVLSGDPLTLLIKDENEQKKLTVELARALRGNVVQLSTGDYLIISQDR